MVGVRDQNSSAFVVESWWVSAGSSVSGPLKPIFLTRLCFDDIPHCSGPVRTPEGLIVKAQDPPRPLWTLSLVPGLNWT